MILLPSRDPDLNPVENIWQYLPHNAASERDVTATERISP
jgi:hypothetical protein